MPAGAQAASAPRAAEEADKLQTRGNDAASRLSAGGAHEDAAAREEWAQLRTVRQILQADAKCAPPVLALTPNLFKDDKVGKIMYRCTACGMSSGAGSRPLPNVRPPGAGCSIRHAVGGPWVP